MRALLVFIQLTLALSDRVRARRTLLSSEPTLTLLSYAVIRIQELS
jgi:hypothetical protein